MPIVHALTDAEVSDDERRRSVFSGNLFVYSPRPSTLALANASRGVLEYCFGTDPEWAQQEMAENEFVAHFNDAAGTLARIVLPLATVVVGDFGCDPDATFIGAPSLVATTGMGFLAHGLGAPQHPHRDTWFAASPSEMNWWIPLHDLDASASFAFHPAYWDLPVENTSSGFDYHRWRENRRIRLDSGLADALAQPRPLEPIDLTPDIRISCPAGAVILSSAAQLYSAVPNETARTHFSVHFGVVSQADLQSGSGASNLDARPRGTPLSSFVRCSDLTPLPEDLIALELGRRSAPAR